MNVVAEAPASITVLVLLAVHNGRPWLSEQIESILAQRSVVVRLVASDDASTDGSKEFIKSLGDSVTLLSFPVPAGSAAKNFFRLIQSCHADDCDFVAFADQDDIWHPYKLLLACTTLASSNASGYSSAVQAFWPNGRSKFIGMSGRQTGVDFLFEGAGQGCTFVFTAHDFLQFSQFVSFNNALMSVIDFHDWAAYAFFRARNCAWVFDSNARLEYRQHESNAIGSRGTFSAVKKRLGLIRSGWYSAQVNAIYALATAANPNHPELARFTYLRAESQGSLRGKLRWVSYLWRRSRRRCLDRGVLALAALIGWI